MTWRDHIDPGDDYTVLQEYDDGSAVVLAGYAGGNATGGAWSSLALLRIDANGRQDLRRFEASSDWKPIDEWGA